MTDTLTRATAFEFRTLDDDELRVASDVFREAMHDEPLNDEKWATMRRVYEPGRALGAFAGTTLIGTAASLSSGLTVPGGAILPMAGVTAVGVRTDHRRRGALTGLMRRQLAEFAAAGEVFAALHAAETTIYGRYGYGLATRVRTLRIRSPRAGLRPEVPTAGTVRLITMDEAMSLLPAVYERLRTRPGMMGRSPAWWVLGYENRMTHGHFRAAAHYDEHGEIDGFVGYRPGPFPSDDPRVGASIAVLDFVAANQGVENDLWRFLLDIDLVEEVTVYSRPVDDPLEAMLVDFFAIRSERDDELWLRIVDVPRALAARAYGSADQVVIEVADPLLPANSGRYLISPHGTERTSAPAALTMDVETLAMIYLGEWRPSKLAEVGRLTAHDPTALASADHLFATDRPSWCGSLF
ncbi:MAG: GNAT family N-acetyltransferase [Actinophytocola sp.]|uniref:GNAT family N-acetyltransferase n=1 Tax=Actinophytocola sp. TaxID=1872138 RepID=UPI003D6AD606